MASEARHTDQREDLAVFGVPGDHAIFRRSHEDGTESTYSLYGDDEIQWAIDQLEELQEAGDGE